MHEVLGLITARGGSKGLPRKAVRALGGRPLIAWTIAAARASQRLTRVIVSTDDAEIEQVCIDEGAEVPFRRPDALATDSSPHILTIEHALQWLDEQEGYRPEHIVLLQPTSPFRSAADIDEGIELARNRGADAVVGVCAATDHPFLTKRLRADGSLEDFVSTDISYLRRQDLPAAYSINGALYVNRRESVLRDRTVVPAGALAYVMPPERSLDIDTPWDLQLAEAVLQCGVLESEVEAGSTRRHA
jgi:CMP-N,N'-diacetyllegionaminic acid synthase